jgi:peptidoglycan/LPS O-acetylase OafA/YrhL
MLIVEQLVEKLFDLLGLEPVWPGSRESLYLTVVAVLVAIGFLSFLFFDIIRRWRRARRHHRSQPETWREILLKPIQGIQALRNDLRQILRERARRERRRRRRPPVPPP